jgi:N-acetyl sugar amidotransferase
MRYCRRCITPSTRPNIALDAEGVCSACRAFQSRERIDWTARRYAFGVVARRARARAGRRGYDCVIPVSGGKDSTWQVVTCLEHGLTPLAVTWKTPARTELGARNLANLVALGVDHVDYQVNPRVERKFVHEALVRFGTPAIPMHMAIFSIPVALAVRLRIPLVVWGENSAFEYGGTDDELSGFQLDARWRRSYGVTHGTTASDWVSPDLSEKELTPYFGPAEDELTASGLLAVFLGYYFPWDPATSRAVAAAHGFQSRAEGPKTGWYDYADIDDDFISVHHWLKWYKFGFTRTFDNLSLEIRHGRLSREEAVEALRVRGDETPWGDIEKFCAFLEIGQDEFFSIAERFRNPAVWRRRDGRWTIDDFLVPDWKWA